MRPRPTLLLLLLLTTAAYAQASFANSYTLSVQAGASSYQGTQPISITGLVSPNPGPNTTVFIQVFNPAGALVLAGSPGVNSSTGRFTFDGVTGGTSDWVTGKYDINATWGAYGPQLNAKASFSYAAASTSTTSSSSSSATTVSSSSPSQSSTTTAGLSSSTSTTSAASSGGGIPEFPYELITIFVVTVVVLASYLVLRRPR